MTDQFDGLPGHVWVAQQRITMDDDYRNIICDWLRANDIDPATVPQGARASVVGGKLTIPIKVKSAGGFDVIDPSEDALLTHTVTVPVKVRPSKDVQLWLIPRCPTCHR